MSEMQSILNRLIQDRKEGTESLYAKIPFFLRTRLHRGIDNKSWASVSEGCERGDEQSKAAAHQMYHQLLNDADAYIQHCRNIPDHNTKTDNGILMTNDILTIKRNFGDDAVKFVTEVAICLENEKQLVFMHNQSQGRESMESPENMTDVMYQQDDEILQQAENLLTNVEQSIHTAARMRNELERAKESNVNVENIIKQLNDCNEVVSEIEGLEGFNSLTREIQNHGMMVERLKLDLQTSVQNAMDNLQPLKDNCEFLVGNLAVEVREWLKAEAKRSVKIGPETNSIPLFNRFQRLGSVLHNVTDWFQKGHMRPLQEQEEQSHTGAMPLVSQVGNLQASFDQIKQQFFQSNLVVTAQPKGVISIENKGTKESPNYCTKKTQPFYTKIRILGGESFPNLKFSKPEIELVAEKDLEPTALSSHQKPTPVTGKDKKACLQAELPAGNSPAEISFKVKIENFIRVEQNTVYKQFFRLWYRVKVHVDDSGTEYTMTALSLPFTFNTGANQILEHMGARMWYFAGVDDMYQSGCQCPDPMTQEQVITMLDNRIAYLDCSDRQMDTPKRRHLSEQEKAFLREQLPVASDGTVSMQGFLKDDMKKAGTGEKRGFSFYTWFSGVVHTLESLLARAWLDGVIFGFCSGDVAKEVLMKKEIPEGTFLLRPRTSNVKNTSSAGATADLVIEIKMRRECATVCDPYEEQFEVTSAPLLYKTICKNTLYGLVKNIRQGKKSIAKFLYGKNGSCGKVEALQGYVTKLEEKPVDGYNAFLEKIQEFNLRRNSAQPAPSDPDCTDENGNNNQEPSARKRRYNRSQSNASSSRDTFASPASTGSHSNPDDFSSGSPSAVSMVTSADIKQESFTLGLSGMPVTDQSQGHRSGIQGSTVPGQVGSGNIGQSRQNNHKFNMTFGKIQIDTSQICQDVADSSMIVIDEETSRPTAITPEHLISNDLTTLSYSQSGNQYQWNPQPVQVFTVLQSENTAPYTNSSPRLDASNLPLTPESVNSLTHSSSQESTPSPSSMTSPPTFPTQSPNNLPTVLTEANEQRKSPRRRGGNVNNTKNNRKQSPASFRNQGQTLAFIANGNNGIRQTSQHPANVIVEPLHPTHNFNSTAELFSDLIYNNQLEETELTLNNFLFMSGSESQTIELSPADSGHYEEETE